MPRARLSTCLQIVGESAGLRLVYTPAAAEVVLHINLANVASVTVAVAAVGKRSIRTLSRPQCQCYDR